MAPPPEYDKEPKAPDKSATNIPIEDSKPVYNLVNDQQNNSEAKTINPSANAEVEMAPPPEYDKEPKAPDKSATNIPIEDSKPVYNLVNDQQNNSEAKTINPSANAEVENNKHVEALDDGQLRALLDEAITYKCPKDREGKSNLFKELLESVEQDEQACEAAARTAGRARRVGGARGRRALPHSNSLQDLVAALAAEPAPRRRAHAPAPAPVSARALHGGSLPSGVDTSFLLSDEPVRAGGAEYVATVRCVNPSPLAERRVSASDAHDTEPRDRRSKPAFPMTYTARATLEIGTGGVGPGRAVTCTTASNQVRTPLRVLPLAGKPPRGPHRPWPPAQRLLRWYSELPPAACLVSPARPARPVHPVRPVPSESEDARERREYRERVGDLVVPGVCPANPTNIRSMTIARPPAEARDQLAADKTATDKHDRKPRSRNADVEVAIKKTVPETTDDNTVYRSKIYHSSGNKQKISPSNPKKTNPNPCILPKTNNEECKTKSETAIICEKPPIGRTQSETANGNNLIETVSRKGSSNSIDIQNKSPSPHSSKITNSDPNFPSKSYLEDNKTKRPARRTDQAETDKLETVNKTEIEMVSLRRTSISTKKDNVSFPSNPKKPNPNSNIVPKSNNEDHNTKHTVVHQHEPQPDQADADKSISETELVEMVSIKGSSSTENSNEFSLFIANQQRLLQAIETNNYSEVDRKNEVKPIDVKQSVVKTENRSEIIDTIKEAGGNFVNQLGASEGSVDAVSAMDCSADKEIDCESTEVVKIERAADFKVSGEKCNSAEVPSNAAILLTLYKRLLASPCNADNPVLDIKSVEARPLPALDGAAPKPPKKKKDKITARLSRKPNDGSNKKKDIIRNALKKLFFDNITQSDSTKLCGKAGAASKEVDSAIPFSCITTPEVVAGGASAAPAPPAAPADLKPLQLGPEHRAVASPRERRADAPDKMQIPRNARSSRLTAHGLVVPRGGATFGAAAAAAADEFKKSLDENGNAVPTFVSPHQQKKQRRKKSSKNETVIKSHQIDGYQGNKDLNEVLRFIESSEPERQAKRHDDKKKRSAERRKTAAPRASSLDDLSRAAAAPAAHAARPAPAKPERRSWGDDARAYREPEPDAHELTDFQTVTKKRRARRRADEPEPRRAPPLRSPPEPPEPRSDRSNDSNDDLDSVHSLPSLPARALPPPPLASYADIARTRHNIPDLIESCNYYGEGEGEGEGEARGEEAGSAAGAEADAYPALEARARRAAARTGAPRAAGRASPPAAPAAPAPDVLAGRRPPVVLRAAAPRARDMDGVTFGFDVNEQLLGGARRPRCDLLRYLPPAPPPDTAHLLQIVDYVGSAWEDVVRCGGKARYFSE